MASGLDQLLARWGPRAGDAAPQETVRSVEDVAGCAVSLAFLLDFYDTCIRPVETANSERLTTKAVVETMIKPATRDRRCHFAQLVPKAVRAPHQPLTAFISHAFGGCGQHGWEWECECAPPGVGHAALLLAALAEQFDHAVAAEVFVWLHIFAINQHMPDADLHGGNALQRTIAIAGETLVVLDPTGFPFRRLWCLFEMGSTPAAKLVLLTHGFSEANLADTFRTIDVKSAECFDPADAERIRKHVREVHGSLSFFQRLLRLRLLLRPTSFEADLHHCCPVAPTRGSCTRWRAS